MASREVKPSNSGIAISTEPPEELTRNVVALSTAAAAPLECNDAYL